MIRDAIEMDDEPSPPRPPWYWKPRYVFAVLALAVMFLAAAGFGLYQLIPDSPSAPAGWEEFTFEEDGFKGFFPEKPAMWSSPMRVPGGPRFKSEGIDGAVEYRSSTGDGLHIVVRVFRYQPDSPARESLPKAIRDAIEAEVERDGETIQHRRVQWLGTTADEYRGAQGVLRFAATERALFFAVIQCKDESRLRNNEVIGFFDNFVLLHHR